MPALERRSTPGIGRRNPRSAITPQSGARFAGSAEVRLLAGRAPREHGGEPGPDVIAAERRQVDPAEEIGANGVGSEDGAAAAAEEQDGEVAVRRRSRSPPHAGPGEQRALLRVVQLAHSAGPMTTARSDV